MRSRATPRLLGAALRQARGRVEPKTLLAAVQNVWAPSVGGAVAAEAEPVAERDGVVTVACRSATWAQELDLLQTELLERLNGNLTADASGGPEGHVNGLRFTADGSRHAN
jgi:predicted nucleic acid-binding Zn ribbon protein